MPNLATVLKEEIRRLAKREIKADTGKTRQAVAQYRRDIALLKRFVRRQQKEIAFLKAMEQKRLAAEPSVGQLEEKVRYSARSVRAQRNRLGLSAADYGKLVGVSSLTIYHWEHGKSRPRKAQLARLVAVRGVGKREAMQKLEMFKAKAKQRTNKVRKLARKKPR